MASIDEENVPNTGDEFSDTVGDELEGDEGNAEPAEGVKDEPKAPNYEKMFKDTQAAYTKSRQEIAAYKAKIAALENAIVKNGVSLDPQVAEELEALKYSDPEAWRQKINAIENAKAKEVTSEITRQAEIARRREVLAQWNENNPDAKVTDYIVKNVLPQGITKRLQSNELSFEGFLAEASNFLRQTKIGSGNSSKAGRKDPMRQANGTASSNVGKEVDYKDMIF